VLPVQSARPTLTAHAINRASLRALDAWQRTRRRDEGLYDWLLRHAYAAWRVRPDGAGYHRHLGLLWIFEDAGTGPVLKTIVRE
jgi:hypothetical protein